MYYNMEKVNNNIFVLDSHKMEIPSFEGDYCFIIGHHIKDEKILTKAVKELSKGGFYYFNIFGQQADLWEKIINKEIGQTKIVEVEASQVAREEMAYNLVMYSNLKPEKISFLISDDEFFTEYLLEDLYDILENNVPFTINDWITFRSGYEFNFQGQDAIVSISNGVIIGFLGKEEKFQSIFKAFNAKIFEGKNFYEVWREIKALEY